MASTIVVALGGNALQRQGEASSEQQQRVADDTVKQLLPLIQAGHNVAIVHGNGPQVGNIVLHEEAINTEDVPTLPNTAGCAQEGDRLIARSGPRGQPRSPGLARRAQKRSRPRSRFAALSCQGDKPPSRSKFNMSREALHSCQTPNTLPLSTETYTPRSIKGVARA